MDVSKEELIERFTWVDYSVFVAVLALSAGIGIFYGFIQKNQTSQDFLMAGRSMTTFPVAMSLIASFMSAITLLGNPSEVYQTGLVYIWIGIGYAFVMLGAAHIYLPVFWDLQVTSAYEYLEKRFNVAVRRICSFLFIFQMSMYMAIVVYAPSLALSQVTGINVYVSVTAICFVCIFYTTIGGMKAVLWTDSLQVIIMYGCIIYIIVQGTISEGGFLSVWAAAARGGRTDIWIFDPSLITRHTFWNLSIGGYFLWITIYGVNQTQVQRYLCVRERKMAKKALYINIFGLVLLMLTCSYAGLLIYARYEHCDPYASGYITTVDQLLPLFVMDVLGTIKGLPGLFVAGTFSGALSTVSSGMNSLAAIALEDFVKGYFWIDIPAKKEMKVSKILSVFFGILTFALVFVAENLGKVLSAALSLYGVVGGPVLGAFTLGMLFPWANGKGAFVGTVCALCITMWINVGYQVGVYTNAYTPLRLPVNIDQCSNMSMDSVDPMALTGTTGVDPDFSPFYQLTYLHYSTVACFTVVIVGMAVSALTGFNDIRKINPKYISPIFYWFRNIVPGGTQLGVDFKGDGNKEVIEVSEKPRLSIPEILIEDFSNSIRRSSGSVAPSPEQTTLS